MELWKWRWRPPQGALLLYLTFHLLLSMGVVVVWAICPSKCVCNDDTLVVSCERANLDVVPITLNPAVKELRLKNNNIKAVIAAFTFYKDLEYLDLAHNKLVAVETNSFEVQLLLKVLKLNHNQISRLTNNTFAGLRSLRVLTLSENLMEVISDRLFAHLRALEELDLSANSISRLEEGAFRGLSALRTLRLRDNKLTSAPPPAVWTPLGPSLSHLHLGSNAFLSLGADSFRPLGELQELVLDSCGTTALTLDTFLGLRQLRVLRLRDNAFTAIPTHAWEHLQRLEELYLGQNHFEAVGPNAFAGLARLRSVEMSGGRRLNLVRAAAFSANTDLRKVVLSHNAQLGRIEPGAFDGLPLLRHLSLRGGAFVTLRDDLLAWDELEVLDLRDNRFECNCSLLWLRNLLVNRNLTIEPYDSASSSQQNLAVLLSSGSVRCAGPTSLETRLLAELGAGELGCFYPDAKKRAVLGIVGATAVLVVLVLVLLVYKYRKRVTSVLKDKWTDGALRRKDLHYEKTNDEEENNILQAAQQSLKMTPVTEL